MGMYTHMRGWIFLSDIEFTEKKFNKIIKKADTISERSTCCVSCTVFNMGFDFSPYIFIGGQIKNYDDDWEIYVQFLKDNFPIQEMFLEKKYEENGVWTRVE